MNLAKLFSIKRPTLYFTKNRLLFSTKIPSNPYNIPSNILLKMENKIKMHRNLQSPIGILKHKIERFFYHNFFSIRNNIKIPIFTPFDSLDPIVTVKQNFDDLSIPSDHPSRSLSDTFYFDKDRVLRTHTTAHEIELIQKDQNAFIVSGDCYRKDKIDSVHYPIFHQLEIVRTWDRSQVSEDYVLENMKNSLNKLVEHLFSEENVEFEWDSDVFPFTHPSFQLNLKFPADQKKKKLEVLGCGLLTKKVFEAAGREERIGWAAGLGLERLAMALFDIPDIRLFHSEDARFKEQFVMGDIVKFKRFSKFPACQKDISFWVDDSFSENEFYAVVRSCAGDLVESIELIDSFEDPKCKRNSRCYRIKYRSFSRNLVNEEIDLLQDRVRSEASKLGSLQIR